jgi:glutathione synthase/RimK-type ligase-like ATP-grasp enzyme
MTARSTGGGFSANSETAALASALTRTGWDARLFDWRDLGLAGGRGPAEGFGRPAGPRASHAAALVKHCDVLVHRYLGSLREGFSAEVRQYLAWIEEGRRGPIVNSLAQVRYGARKDYLFRLQEAGFPTVPSRFHPASGGLAELRRAVAESGWRHAVVKPIDGELCQDVHLVSELDERRFRAMAARTSGFVLQPFIEGIRAGQRSLLLVVLAAEPVPLYGMLKIPSGWLALARLSTVCQIRPSRDELDLATRLLRAWPGGPIQNGFVRVDFVLDRATPLVMEVETANPEGGLACTNPATQTRYAFWYGRMLEATLERATAAPAG